MSNPPYVPDAQAAEFRRLMHALANKAAIVDSNIAVLQSGRVLQSQKEILDDAVAASRDLVDIVVELQKIVGMR